MIYNAASREAVAGKLPFSFILLYLLSNNRL
jgi:hypothetical protein